MSQFSGFMCKAYLLVCFPPKTKDSRVLTVIRDEAGRGSTSRRPPRQEYKECRVHTEPGREAGDGLHLLVRPVQRDHAPAKGACTVLVR